MLRSIVLVATLLQGTASTPATGTVEGRIVLANGAPAAGMRLALSKGTSTLAPAAALASIVLTDRDGRFRVENVAPGEYYVLAGDVDWPTYYPGVAESNRALAVTVAARETVGPLNFTADPALTKGTIEVAVRRSDTAAPIAGATVALKIALAGKLQVEAVTDIDGIATLRAVPAGRYFLDARADEHWNSQVLEDEIVVSPERREQRISIELKRAWMISGRVLGVGGTPVAGVRVSVLRLEYRNGRRAFVDGGTSETPGPPTGADGIFHVQTAGPGSFYLRAHPDPWQAFPAGLNTVGVYFPGVSNPDQAIPIDVTSETPGRDFHLTREPLFSVSGTVDGVAWAAFYLVRRGTDTTDTLPFSISSPRRGPEFEIRGVPSGQYDLYVRYVVGSVTASARIPIVVSNTVVRDIKVVINPSITVQGRVTFGEGVNPNKLIRVGLDPVNDLSRYLGSRVSAEASRARTELTFNHVGQAEHRVSVDGLPADAYVADILQNESSVMADGIVRVAPDTIVDVILARSLATFRVATLRAGVPVSDAIVLLVPAGARRANPLLRKRSEASALGIASLTGVAPGEYELFAFPNPPPWPREQDADFLEKYRPRARTLTVPPDATGTIDVPLEVIDDPAVSTPLSR